jgi:LysR family transcriptional regulator, hydrogen peroxide-inducible genes activator
MELHQLRYFAKVAELGNFTRAAEACFVSQPSLSQQIIKLERELKQPLFERLGRGVRLTDAGRVLKEHADQVLKLLDDARARIVDSPEGGRLTIAAIPTVAPYLVPQMLQDFRRECPGAQIEILEETTKAALDLCTRGEADLAILALPIEGEHLHVEPLFTEELLLVLPKSHPAAKKPRLTLKDVADEPFVLLNEAHCLTDNALSFCRRKSFQPIITSRMSQLTTLQQLVSLGHGLSFVPEMAARIDTDKRRVYRNLAGEQPKRTIGLAWHEYRYQTQLFRRFTAWLRTWSRTFETS